MLHDDATPVLNENASFVLDREKGLWEIRTAGGSITPEPAATEVMGLIDGKRTLDQIADHMADTSGSPKDVTRQTVHRVVNELQGLGVLNLESRN